MSEEEKKAIESMERFAYTVDMTAVTANEMKIALNLIKKQQEENEKLKKLLDERFIYVTGARTVYTRLMSLDKEIIVKDDLKLRNEIKQDIAEIEKKDKIIDEIAEMLEKFPTIYCPSHVARSKDEWKQYFEKKVENGN